MYYLFPYVKKCRKAFLFWWILKTVFFLLESVMLVVYIMCIHFYFSTPIFGIIEKGCMIQSVVIWILLQLQEDGYRQNKYDKMI